MIVSKILLFLTPQHVGVANTFDSNSIPAIISLLSDTITQVYLGEISDVEPMRWIDNLHG
jgi:hypothetical protein